MEPVKSLSRTKTMSLIISALTRLSIDCGESTQKCLLIGHAVKWMFLTSEHCCKKIIKSWDINDNYNDLKHKITFREQLNFIIIKENKNTHMGKQSMIQCH